MRSVDRIGREFESLRARIPLLTGHVVYIDGSAVGSRLADPANLPQHASKCIYIVTRQPGDEPSPLDHAIITQRPVELITEPHMTTWLVTT